MREGTANVTESPVNYPVTKDNPNSLLCNFPWFGLVSIRINKKISCHYGIGQNEVFSAFLMYMNDFFAFSRKREDT